MPKTPKDPKRPGQGRTRNRPPGRWDGGPGRGGAGGQGGRGTPHRSSSATRRQALAAVLAFIAMPAGVVLGIAAYLAHGYGVI